MTVTTSCCHVLKHVIAVTSWKRQVTSQQGAGPQKNTTPPGGGRVLQAPIWRLFSILSPTSSLCQPKISMPGCSGSSVLWLWRREMQGERSDGHSGCVSCQLLIWESHQAHRVAELRLELFKTVGIRPALAQTVPCAGNTEWASQEGQGKPHCGAFTKGIS